LADETLSCEMALIAFPSRVAFPHYKDIAKVGYRA